MGQQISLSNRSATGLALGLGLTLVACAEDSSSADEQGAYELTIDVEANPQVDFSSYTSFDIVDPTPNAEGDPPPEFVEVQAELEDAIIAEMSAKGLTRDPNSPQLLINPMVNVDAAISAGRFYESVYGWFWGYEYLWTVEYDYADGSLVLDVIDRGNPDNVEDDLLVYRGAAHGLLAEDIELIEDQIDDATQAIFDQWPG